MNRKREREFVGVCGREKERERKKKITRDRERKTEREKTRHKLINDDIQIMRKQSKTQRLTPTTRLPR